ncbi:MAG: cytochrome C, partial [Bacteroidota bacterium]
QITRGEYLANHVTLCMDCHSTRDWDIYSAPMMPGTEGKGGDVFPEEAGFPGTYYAPNITPSALSGWSDAELYRAIASGQTKHDEALFPLMPYLSYSTLDVEDAKAIIAYLKALKPIENDVPRSKPTFPFSLIMKTIPTKAQPIQRPEISDSIAYGKYITTIAACADCHTPMEKGQPIEHLTFAGGMEFTLPNGKKVISANITPDKEFGIGALNKNDFIKMFKFYENNNSLRVNEGEFNTIMPWVMYAGMTENDLGAIYTYLRTVTPIKYNSE